MARNQRAATQSEQAKNAAAIAAAKSKEDDKDPPAAPLKRKRGRPKKDTQSQPKGLKAKPAPSAPLAPVEEEPEAVDIDWKDADGIALTWKLITAIEDNPEIRCRSSEFSSGGQIFGMTERAQLHITEMGQNGGGIDHEEDIQPGTALKTKWDLIKADSPWFFHMRSLIGERPNLMPTGLGNNNSEVDMSILLPINVDDSSSAPHDTMDLPDSDNDLIDDQEPGQSPIPINDSDDSDAPPIPTLASVKRKEHPARRTTNRIVATKPVTAKNKFAAAAIAEEETVQQQLKLKRVKQANRKDVQLERLKWQASAKADKARAKLELARLKLTQEHGSGAASAFASSSRGFSFYDDDLPVLRTPSSDSDSTTQGMDSYNFSSMSSGFV
ncbi:hypothetical protein C8R44DRAFT_978105 [Mycena epipterygia]|nr:hypothetical protein C8R44DRAFT_978105 [Mycena epipterygia]